ncbi:class I SAM-dependent DNA methyltransferase [Rosistilla ulvae]
MGKIGAEEFVERWKDSGGAELANSQSFLKELCDLLDVPHPEPTKSESDANTYVFEKAVEFNNGDGTVSFGRVDLYRAGCFVLESKQGSERRSAEQSEALATTTRTAKKLGGTAKRGTPAWDRAMQAARKQAEGYAKAIPDEWPPFLVVVDVGNCFDLYSDFSGTGKNYVPFPDPRSYRIALNRLHEETVRDTLRLLWTDPYSLDPSKQSADVTRDIATRLAKLAKSLESEHDAETVAGFLMRCLFTMFAEDVELIRKDSFTELLLSLRFEPQNFKPMVESLWEAMDEGKFSTILREKVPRFNGKFFKDRAALALNKDQVELLLEAAEHKWDLVEPAIFGTLLERALDPVERHKLGAHYTPRAYVERLVMPTIIEPLREKWEATYAAAIQLHEEGKGKDAVKLLRDFHGELCETRVLDPACGSGNFLYVSMELMKRLEGEVVSAMASFGDDVLPGITIDPHQFLGIEINPRAAALAELVLWIGFIQWHRRTRNEVTPPEPILKNYENIECRDAILDWDGIEPVTDDDGNPVTRWDGRTTKQHPVTGEEVPDEGARVQELRYINPQKAEWPEADYIVGNPPFVGNKRMREVLGEGYTKTLRAAYNEVPESADYVMFWWSRSSQIVGAERACHFGLITTNSLTQTFNNRVVRKRLTEDGNSLIFAVPDHPWVDSTDGAQVRIAMTVVGHGEKNGQLATVCDEELGTVESPQERLDQLYGMISSGLRIGFDAASLLKLEANQSIACPGVQLSGQGFVVDADQVASFVERTRNDLVRPYVTGRDISQQRRESYVVDAFGLEVSELRSKYSDAYQHLLVSVKPQRDQNPRAKYREEWWLHSEPRRKFRKSLDAIDRMIVTSRTSRHRCFQFMSTSVLAETKVLVIALADASRFGVLSSRIHVLFANATGGWLGVGNDSTYNHSVCFDCFPFPVTDDVTKKRIGDLAEQLDAHRKRQQEQHPTLTMTGMYNVLEKLRSGEKLTAKEQAIHEQGLVSVLKQIHDDLDAAVFDAYGWPHDLEDEEILQRLVDLNLERAEEESRGIIRWLRPEFQNPDGATQTAFSGDDGKAKPAKKAATVKIKKQPWPKTLPGRMVAIQSALHQHAVPAAPDKIAAYYTRANKADVAELLETLAAVGNVRKLDDGRFAVYRE